MSNFRHCDTCYKINTCERNQTCYSDSIKPVGGGKLSNALNKQTSVEDRELKPCPFCRGKAVIAQRGTTRQSHIITCENCGCTLETGEVWSGGQQWNNRPNERKEDA